MLSEFFMPTPASATPYDRGSQAVWHAVLGAALMMGISSVLIVGLIYIGKELIDVFVSGGTVADSAEDWLSVIFGAVIVASPIWPVWLIVLGVSVFLVHQGNFIPPTK